MFTAKNGARARTGGDAATGPTAARRQLGGAGSGAYGHPGRFDCILSMGVW